MWSWKWRRELFLWEHELVRELQIVVERVRLKEGVGDSWVWCLDSSSEHSVQVAYIFFADSLQATGDAFLSKKWNKMVPHKMAAFT